MKNSVLRQRRFFTLVVLFLALLTIGTQCDKEPIEFQYHFLENVAVYPAAMTYHLQDTLWLEYKNTDNRYLDQKTNQQIAQDSVRFWLTINYEPIEGNAGSKQNYWDFVVSSNAQTDFEPGGIAISAHINVTCRDRSQFKLGIVPKVKGNYRLYFSDLGYIYSCISKPTSKNPSLIDFQFSTGQDSVFLNVSD